MKKYRFIPIILLAFVIVPNQGLAQVEQGAALVLWRMINQARAHPIDTIRSLGIDEAAARQALGDDQWIIDKGLPPVAWNDELSQAALGHGNDMIAHLYYSSVGLDGSTPVDRIRAAGYAPVSEGELLGALAFAGYIDATEAAKIVFQNWVRDEFNPLREGQKHIFNPEFKEMGAAFIGAILHLDQEIPPNVFVAVADFGEPEEIRNYLLGNVYRDVNGNGAMEPEEAVPGATVIVRGIGSSGSSSVVSGLQGQYQVPLPDWQLIIIDVMDDQRPLLTGFLAAGDGESSLMIDLKIP